MEVFVTEQAAAACPTPDIYTRLPEEGVACSRSRGAEVNSLAAEHAISLGQCACVSEFADINYRLSLYQISLKIGMSLCCESKLQSVPGEHRRYVVKKAKDDIRGKGASKRVRQERKYIENCICK